MITATELFRRLEAAGVHARLEANPLRLMVGPESAISPELRAELEGDAARAGLIQLLRERTWQAGAPGRTYGLPVGVDPRPDLLGSDLWASLLRLAGGDAADFGGVYGRLHGARCCGAVLESRSGRWKLAPTIDLSERLSVWASRESWDADAERWLKPRSREIVELLRQLPPPPADTADG